MRSKRYLTLSFQILLIFLLLFPGKVFGQQYYYYDTFESYDLGLISEQNENWLGQSVISDEKWWSAYQSLKILSPETETYYVLGVPTETDFYWNFNFNFHPDDPIYGSTEIRVIGSDNQVALYMSIYRYYDAFKIRFLEGGNYVYLGTFEPDTWNYVELYYNVPDKKFQANLNSLNWIEVETVYIDLTDIKKVQMSRSDATTYLDDFELAWTGELEYPTLPLKFPFETWLAYYQENSDKFSVPTALFTNIANAFSPVAEKMGEISLYIRNSLNPNDASEKGTQLGQAIPIARGYLESIDDFLGGLPLSDFFLFFLLCIALVIIYKVILQIIHIVKP